MGNAFLFKALSSKTRLKIVKTLSKKEMHLSELAREICFSKPVVSKHVKILIKAGLVKKKEIGNIHLLKADTTVLNKVFESFVETSEISIKKDESIFDALKQIPGVQIQKKDGKQYITSIDGEKGFYIYEVDGLLPDNSIDDYKPKKDIIVDLKKITYMDKKKIEVKLKDKK